VKLMRALMVALGLWLLDRKGEDALIELHEGRYRVTSGDGRVRIR